MRMRLAVFHNKGDTKKQKHALMATLLFRGSSSTSLSSTDCKPRVINLIKIVNQHLKQCSSDDYATASSSISIKVFF